MNNSPTSPVPHSAFPWRNTSALLLRSNPTLLCTVTLPLLHAFFRTVTKSSTSYLISQPPRGEKREPDSLLVPELLISICSKQRKSHKYYIISADKGFRSEGLLPDHEVTLPCHRCGALHFRWNEKAFCSSLKQKNLFSSPHGHLQFSPSNSRA